MTHPYGGRPGTPAAAPPPPSSRRPTRWAAVGIPVVLAGLVALAVAAYLVVDDPRTAGTLPSITRSTGSAVPSSDLEGTWAGDGALTDCAGFDEGGCPAARSVTLRIDCSGKSCVVTPFDRSYGRPPLRFEEGRYRATGPVPPEVAPTCGGTPTSALWRLELAVQDGRLEGGYAESTIQSFDCGATWLRWEVTFDRA